MTIKKILPLLIFALLLSGCGSKKVITDSKKTSGGNKILINELPLADRPFITLVPHASNRLFTFVGLNINKATSSSLDLEYQSGDLLKGVTASIDNPIPETFIKAIILGSCSTGGKCSFDKDLKAGTIKLRLKLPGQDATNLLKGDFTFINGQPNLPDGKVSFVPSKITSKDNLIMMNSFGLPKALDQGVLEVAPYPIVISSTSDTVISGSLTVNQAGITSAYIYDGSGYKPLKIIDKGGTVTVALNQKPWSMNAEIVRDDEKGSKESLNLYLVGPIVLTK